MRNLYKNYDLLGAKGLFWLIKMGWLSLADVRRNLHLRNTTTGRKSSDTHLSSCSAPESVDVNPPQRVRLRRRVYLTVIRTILYSG